MSLLVNGRPHGFFPTPRGLRKGDPISMIVSIFLEEALDRNATKYRELGR